MLPVDFAPSESRHWPTYRPRRAVHARRLHEPLSLSGHFYRDGYLVCDVHGQVAVVGVADFEALYELAQRGE